MISGKNIRRCVLAAAAALTQIAEEGYVAKVEADQGTLLGSASVSSAMTAQIRPTTL